MSIKPEKKLSLSLNVVAVACPERQPPTSVAPFPSTDMFKITDVDRNICRDELSHNRADAVAASKHLNRHLSHLRNR